MATRIRKSRKKSRFSRTRKKPVLTNTEHHFWLAHGCNFLNSSYSEGHWDPIFPEIYEGKDPGDPQSLVSRIHTLFPGDEGQLSEEGTTMGAWCVQTPKKTAELQFGLVSEGHALNDLLKPCSVPVWAFFENLKNALKDFQT